MFKTIYEKAKKSQDRRPSRMGKTLLEGWTIVLIMAATPRSLKGTLSIIELVLQIPVITIYNMPKKYRFDYITRLKIMWQCRHYQASHESVKHSLSRRWEHSPLNCEYWFRWFESRDMDMEPLTLRSIDQQGRKTRLKWQHLTPVSPVILSNKVD